MVVVDLGAQWRSCFPTAERDAPSGFAGPPELRPIASVKTLQCGGAEELRTAAAELGICATAARARISRTSSLVERAVRQVEEGTRTVLLRAGLPSKWRPDVAVDFCLLCNISEAFRDAPWSQRRNRTAPLD